MVEAIFFISLGITAVALFAAACEGLEMLYNHLSQDDYWNID